MTDRRSYRNIAIALFLSLAYALAASAQQDSTTASSPQQAGTDVPTAPAPDKTLTNYVEVGGSYRQLTNDFGDWSGGYARAVYAEGKNIWTGEVNGQHEFSDG